MLGIPSKRRQSLLRISVLSFFSFLLANGVAATNDANVNAGTRQKAEFSSWELNQRFSEKTYIRSRQRQLNHRHKSQYYEFLDSAQTNSKTTLLDVWLCLACALGWSIWLVSTKQPPHEFIFEQQESAKAMGHVLQVSLGEDTLGTGIPVYYAVVDFVVEGETDEEHIQVRKIFTSKKLIEEGFANVEVMYLVDDPTTAVLMEDFLDQKKHGEFEAPQSNEYNVIIYFLSLLLIAVSLFGGVRMAGRLETPLYGWISLGIGFLLLFPSAKVLYRLVTHLYSLAGPLTDRPGIIVHGKRLYWKNQCHATLNPMEILGVENESSAGVPSTTKNRSVLELADLQTPSLNNTRESSGLNQMTTPKMFPNAGCGFGNFNVHLPIGRPRASSTVSSISASASQNSEKSSSLSTVPKETSILEKYEMHALSTEQQDRKENTSI